MRRRLLVAGAALLALAAAVVAYRAVTAKSTVEPRLGRVTATSVIGAGDRALGVSADGTILYWQPPPEEGALPSLPISQPPQSGRLAGPLLQQARVLGAAPPPLRACIESSYFGESGVDVNLRVGIELRFGSAARAAEKWRAAAAILADPSINGIGYVDLHSPSHVSVGGSGPELPPPSGGGGGACGG